MMLIVGLASIFSSALNFNFLLGTLFGCYLTSFDIASLQSSTIKKISFLISSTLTLLTALIFKHNIDTTPIALTDITLAGAGLLIGASSSYVISRKTTITSSEASNWNIVLAVIFLFTGSLSLFLIKNTDYLFTPKQQLSFILAEQNTPNNIFSSLESEQIKLFTEYQIINKVDKGTDYTLFHVLYRLPLNMVRKIPTITNNTHGIHLVSYEFHQESWRWELVQNEHFGPLNIQAIQFDPIKITNPVRPLYTEKFILSLSKTAIGFFVLLGFLFLAIGTALKAENTHDSLRATTFFSIHLLLCWFPLLGTQYTLTGLPL